jgi:hypothetical protein
MGIVSIIDPRGIICVAARSQSFMGQTLILLLREIHFPVIFVQPVCYRLPSY